jgi:hypothetical protein
VVARCHAQTLGVNAWQFAVEIGTLEGLGMSRNDLRLLEKGGDLEHRWESRGGKSGQRKFAKATRYGEFSCFILTEQGLATANELSGVSVNGGKIKPQWDDRRRELHLGAVLIKRFRVPARNQELILGAFQEEGWPQRIDDPLPPAAGIAPKKRLHDAINNLNANHTNEGRLRFRGDGWGQGIMWET